MTFRRATTEELVLARQPGPLPKARHAITVLLDDIRSAHNVGLMFRLCDCAGVEALWLGGITAFPGQSERGTNRIGKTGVGGSIEALPWQHVPDPVPAVVQAKRDGYRIVVAEQGQGAMSWQQADYGEATVLVFGHERAGVRDSLLALADEIITLPMYGVTNSLNVATTASAILYEAIRRQVASR